MSQLDVTDLADCSELREVLAAQPPWFVHGLALSLSALVAAAVAWSALTKAELVVRADGRVRGGEPPTRVFAPWEGELRGRVVEAPFAEGDLVRKGDVLVRLDTARLDRRVEQLERTIAALDEELSQLDSLRSLLGGQLGVAQDKAAAELTRAESELGRERERRASEIRRAQTMLKAAEDDHVRASRLRGADAISGQEWTAAQTAVQQAREELVQAELPVDDATVAVARRAVELVERDFQVRQAELDARRAAKHGEAEAARKELAMLMLERDESVLRSPLDGVLVSGEIRVDDILPAGTPILEISPRQGHRFEVLVDSRDVGELRVGMPAHIKFDAYDYQRYGALEATISYVAPDSLVAQGEGATYLVRLELHGDQVGRNSLRGDVRLGLSGTVEIVTGRESLLTILLRKLHRSISLG